MSVRLLPVLLKRFKRGAKILDVGCGNGELVTVLNEEGFKAVGFDAYPETQDTLAHDINDVPYPFDGEQFDAVIVSCSFRFVDERNTAKVIYELGRVTKKGGCILIYDTGHLIADRIMTSLPFRYSTWMDFGNTWREKLGLRPFKYSLMVVEKV